MGDGDVRRMWPWVLGVAAALATVWLVASLLGGTGPGDPDAEPGAVTEPGGTGLEAPTREPAGGAAAEGIVARTEAMRAAARAYGVECEARLDPAAGVGVDAVVQECVERLNAALDAIVASDTVGHVAIDDRLRRHRAHLASLRELPPGEGRAAPVAAVLRSGVEVLAVIRAERYPESLEDAGVIEELRAAAGAIDPQRPLREQQDLLQRYFIGAGALVSAMARPGDPGPGGDSEPGA